MGTSGSTVDVARGVRGIASGAPVCDDTLCLLVNTTLSQEELQRAFPFHTLRYMRHYYTKSFAALMLKCVAVVAEAAVRCRTSTSEQKVDVQPFLSALRVMRLLLPVAMEDGATPCEEGMLVEQIGGNNLSASSEDISLAQSSFQRTSAPKSRTLFTKTFMQSFFVFGYACNDERPEEKFQPLPGQDEPLGKFLVRLLLECCFLRGLGVESGGIPAGAGKNLSLDGSLLWYSGTGDSAPAGGSKVVTSTTHAVRYELLSTMTVLLSYPLLLPPNTPDMFFSEVILGPENASLLTLLTASTLNALLSYMPYGLLPYTSHWVGKEEEVVVMSGRFLCSVICYPIAPNGDGCGSCGPDCTEGSNATSKFPVTHSSRDFIRQLTREEAVYIVHKFQNIVGLRLYARHTCLPDSQRCFGTSDEIMMLLWRLVDLSPACLQALGHEEDALEYILPLLHYALHTRRNPRSSFPLQVVLFILMRLTGVSNFCCRCNASFRGSIPSDFDTFEGTYNDLIIVALCEFLLMPHKPVRALGPTCSAVMSNIAPFVTSVSASAATRLSLVFTSVATRCVAYDSVLSARPESVERGTVVDDQVIMMNVVETVCNIVRHRVVGAAELLHVLVRNKGLVENVVEVFGVPADAGEEVVEQQRLSFRLSSAAPFMFNALLGVVTAANDAVLKAEGKGECPLVAIRETALRTFDLQPCYMVVKRLNPSWDLEVWVFVTHWYSMYLCSPPGTFGDNKSIRMLKFR